MTPAMEALARRYEAIHPHLNERQRRLWLGNEARELGASGARLVAEAVGVAADMVRRGRDELDDPHALPVGRSRSAGGGRRRAEELDPGLITTLDELVEPETRGDPQNPLRWTTKSLAHLVRELAARGHRCTENVVSRLLHEAGYSLQGNAKTIEGQQHPDRDAQFRYLGEQVAAALTAGQPVVSVDTKKKELVGAFKKAGREWRPAGDPVQVNMHDFMDKQLGKAIPYGVYDLAANTGWVSVGCDHDTPAFAVNTLRSWWQTQGRAAYPHATTLTVTADCGGSNGNRVRAWKSELATLATETGLAITVLHLPPGTSKWNKIEHRLFAAISMNWRATPLTCLETVVSLIGATSTETGLTVTAVLDERSYPTGIKIPDKVIKALPITRHDWHGDWNYTLNPTDTPEP
ncbi:MAG TPA: ISAzo13 family transposase, partial [Actinocrinis sp.]|uniref:ISAzo13 family transposase n=1 Tax=Actinocrinis sp. TaxID=1920516 RepID=UPI002DDCE7E6